MKILAKLPESKHFKPIDRTDRWPFIWEAISSSRLRVCADVKDPWQKVWEIRIKEQHAKTDKTIHTNRIDLQCHSASSPNISEAQFLWETQWGGVPHSNGPTLRFYAIPAKERSVIMLSVLLQQPRGVDEVVAAAGQSLVHRFFRYDADSGQSSPIFPVDLVN